MEWVETTAKSLDEAKNRALDQLGVAADEAEYEILEEPKSGLFGRTRGEARVRARVKPAAVRPKQDRRSRGRSKGKGDDRARSGKRSASNGSYRSGSGDRGGKERNGASTGRDRGDAARPAKRDGSGREGRPAKDRSKQQKESTPMSDERPESTVTPQEVGDAAVTFMSGLVEAFGAEAGTELAVDGTDLEVKVSGSELGLMVGPGGRTLIAVQDLARVASQRRLGDHDTRLRIDVGGYREKRRAALEKFAAAVADQVIDAGEAKALEPMPSADRKIVHDAIIEIDGVTSRSEGDDPMRRVIITPE